MTPATLVERFAQRSPVALMVRGLLDYCFSPPFLDPLAETLGRSSYTRQIGFSHLVALLTDVVLGTHPSVRAAYAHDDRLHAVAGLKSFYEKLQHVEPGVSAALVRAVADRLRPVLADRLTPEPIPGLRLLTLDGNKLAPTQRRPAVTRSIPAPMPGQALVLREHATGLLGRVLPHPDAYDNERKLLADVLDWFGPGDCVVADCNFCTYPFLAGLVARGAHAVVRHHGSVGLHPVGPEGAAVPTPTGRASESVVRYAETALEVRCVRVELAAATRAGHREVRVLTTLTVEQADAAAVAELYLGRRTIETAFQELEAALRSEVDTLAYPHAALMGFCVAAAVYGMLEVVRRYAVPAGGPAVSTVRLSHEVRTFLGGLGVALEGRRGMPRSSWPAERVRAWLEGLALRVTGLRYAKSRRGPKKARVLPRRDKRHHEATARLLNGQAPRPTAP